MAVWPREILTSWNVFSGDLQRPELLCFRVMMSMCNNIPLFNSLVPSPDLNVFSLGIEGYLQNSSPRVSSAEIIREADIRIEAGGWGGTGQHFSCASLFQLAELF